MTIIRGGTGAVQTVDKRGASGTTTASASSGGGTATGSISLGIGSGEVVYLKITANSASTNSDFEFFRDSAKTDQIYQALGKDANTSAFTDGTPWSLVTTSDLELDSIYYTFTNNSTTTATTYTVELLALGE